VLAVIGTPRAVLHGIVFGQTGLALAVDAQTAVAGPRSVPFAGLFGGGRLALVAADATAYAIAKDDGSSALYNAPFVDWCD
jgi:hypothetical protein